MVSRRKNTENGIYREYSQIKENIADILKIYSIILSYFHYSNN